MANRAAAAATANKQAAYIPPHHSDIVHVVIDDTRLSLKFTMGAIAYIEEAFDLSIEELATNFSKVHKAKFVIHVLYAGTLYNEKLNKEWTPKKFGDKIKPADFGALLRVCAEALKDALGGGGADVGGSDADGGDVNAEDNDVSNEINTAKHTQKKTVTA